MVNIGSVMLWSVKITGSLHLAILFCIRFHVSRDILQTVATYADAGNTSKHREHDSELELQLGSLVELMGSVELVAKSNGRG